MRLRHGLLCLLLSNICLTVAQAADTKSVAWGMGYMMDVHEKCFGTKLSGDQIAARQAHLLDLLVANGQDRREAQNEFIRGTFEAEGRFPGKTKPPKKECRDADVMKRQMDKI